MGRHPVGVKGRNLTSFPLNNTCKSSDSNDSDVVVVAAGSSIHELDAVSFVGVLWKGLILRKLEAEDSGRWYNNVDRREAVAIAVPQYLFHMTEMLPLQCLV